MAHNWRISGQRTSRVPLQKVSRVKKTMFQWLSLSFPCEIPSFLLLPSDQFKCCEIQSDFIVRIAT